MRGADTRRTTWPEATGAAVKSAGLDPRDAPSAIVEGLGNAAQGGRRTPGVGTPANQTRQKKGDYGQMAEWYSDDSLEGTEFDENALMNEWDTDGALRNSFNNDFEAYMAYQRKMYARKGAGLENLDTYNKAVELDMLAKRDRTGPSSKWEKDLRESYRDSTNKLYTRAQMSGKNRAALSRAFQSGVQQKDVEFENQIQAMRKEESRIAADAVKSLLYQARTAGAEGAAAEAQLLQQWQMAKESETMDTVANVVSGLATLGAGVILL